MSGNRSGVVDAIAAEALYGLGYVATRQALVHVDVPTLLAWRFALAALVVAVLTASGRMRLRARARDLPLLAALALLQPVAYQLGEALGVGRTSASTSGLVLSGIPVACLVASAVVLRRRPTVAQWLGVGLTVAGVAATVVGGPDGGGGDILGYALLLGALVAFALFSVVSERASHLGDGDKTAAMVLAGALAFGGLALGAHHDDPAALGAPLTHPSTLVPVAFLAVGASVGAALLQNRAIRRLGAAAYGTFVGVSTVAALAAGAVLLDERLGWLQWVGGALVLAGVYAANRTPQAAGPSSRTTCQV